MEKQTRMRTIGTLAIVLTVFVTGALWADPDDGKGDMVGINILDQSYHIVGSADCWDSLQQAKIFEDNYDVTSDSTVYRETSWADDTLHASVYSRNKAGPGYIDTYVFVDGEWDDGVQIAAEADVTAESRLVFSPRWETLTAYIDAGGSYHSPQVHLEDVTSGQVLFHSDWIEGYGESGWQHTWTVDPSHVYVLELSGWAWYMSIGSDGEGMTCEVDLICTDSASVVLDISSSTGGSVTTPGEGFFTYAVGSEVQVAAAAEANHHFMAWTGSAVDAGKVADPASAGTTVTMEADYTLQANFTINEDPVYFADAELKAAVEQTLRKTNPTPTDMLGLTSLDAQHKGIASLVGLEYATNLQSLSLASNYQISDISALSGMTSLQVLDLSRNQISDLSALWGLTNLYFLALNDNKINGFSALSGLTNLQTLRLERSGISDLSPLSGLTNLRTLYLYMNQISDISALSGLTNLQRLFLDYNQISNLAPLSGLTSLRDLYLQGNGISDLSPLSGLTNLVTLNAQANLITDLSPLSGLTNLQVLHLHGNGISDVSPLSGLMSLQELFLFNNRISDLSALSGFTNLRRLWLSNNLISDISALLGMTNLRDLDMEANPLDRNAYCHDLQAILLGAPSLVNLKFSGNGNPPGGVSATDGMYENKVTITWNALCPGPGSTQTFQYVVYRSNSVAGTKTALSGNLSGTSFEDATAVQGVHYYYWVNSDDATEFSDPDEGWRSGPPQRTLTTSSTSGGTVTTPGVGAFQYDHGSVVAVAAMPEVNCHFVNWTATAADSGKVANPTSPATTVTMDGDYSLQANFAINTYTLTVNAANGSVSRDPSKPAYTHGETVTLQAVPDAGYEFTGWSGDLAGTSNPATLTMDGDKIVIATFTIIQRILTTSSTAGGTITVPGIGSFEYDHGTTLPIVAVAAANYHFVEWTGTAVDAGKVGDPALVSTTVTMDADYTLQASFAIDQWTLTVSSTAGGTVVAPGEGSFQYDHGTQVTLQAEPEPLFVFAGWRGSIFANSNPCSITMNGDYEVKAHFESVLDVLYVDDDALSDPGPGDPNLSDPNESGTSEHPFDMIQEAIDVAMVGTKVVVRTGTYRESIDLLGKSITVSGLDDDPNDGTIADFPIIDAQGKDSVVRCIQGEDPNCILQGLVITGGKAQEAGGILCVVSSPTVLNCLIVGNRATGLNAGGGIHCQDSNAVFVNCTISANCGGSAGAGVCLSESNAVLLNSIVWENAPTQVRLLGSGGSIVAYTDVAEGWPATANLDVDPCFALPGYWADPADLTKTLPATDLAAAWVGGDYHLQSQAGRWEPLTKAWVIDAATSPCIDAGDPNTPTGKEPLPNGSRINLGAYGGTPQASKSP